MQIKTAKEREEKKNRSIGKKEVKRGRKKKKRRKKNVNKTKEKKEKKFVLRSFYICLKLIVYVKQKAMTNLFK